MADTLLEEALDGWQFARDGDFTRQSFPDFMREYGGALDDVADKAALISLLRESFEDGEARLREAGELRMLQQIVQFNGQPATRLSWMSHGVAHEEYHRAQVALYARLIGLVPALTKMIQASIPPA